jgi:hypothetical protein
MPTGWISRRCSVLTVAAVVLLAASDLSAQSASTTRLIALLRSSDPGRDHRQFIRAVVDAGPEAIAALDRLLQSEASPNRAYTLASICLIGGKEAASILQREAIRGDATVKRALAATLATADSPENRAVLVRMLSDNSDDGGTFQAAALALGLLRAQEGLQALQLITPTPHSAEAETVEIAMQWMTGGEWAVDVKNTGERDRILAAVLRNGMPGLSAAIPVLDETTGKIWRYERSGWTARASLPARGDFLGVVANAMTSSDGTRAVMSAEFRCGPGCEGGAYDVVLRKRSSQWRVVSLVPGWR